MGQPRAVVLGAAGFIGGHLVAALEAKGYEVRRVDRRDGDRPGVKLDLRYWPDAREAVAKSDWVFHLAADMGGVGYFHSDADYGAATDNARITLNVLNACEAEKVDRLFYASSACVYPVEYQTRAANVCQLPEEWIGFGTPDALYGHEKLTGLRWCSKAPFDARVGVLHTVYGPGQESTGPRAKFPPTVCQKALQARITGRLELWGNGNQMRSYLYADDAVQRILTIMESDRYEGPVNVGYEGAISCREAARFACQAAGVDPHIVANPEAGPTGVQARDCSNGKWRQVYGPTNDIHPKEGLARLVEWLDR